MSANLGSVDPSPDVMLTGMEMSMQEGDESTTGNAKIYLTGNGLTVATNSVYNLIWNQVDTGTTVTWTEVDTAA